MESFEGSVAFRKRTGRGKFRHRRRKETSSSDSEEDRRTLVANPRDPSGDADALTTRQIAAAPGPHSVRETLDTEEAEEVSREANLSAFSRAALGSERSNLRTSFVNDDADYSAEGLARLAAATSGVVPREVGAIQASLLGDNDRSDSSNAEERQNKWSDEDRIDIKIEKSSRMDRVLGARANLTGPGKSSLPSGPVSSNAHDDFIPLKPPRDMQDSMREVNATGTASALQKQGADSDESGASEWEREQLRRAGHELKEVNRMRMVSDLERARAVADEESMNLGGRGESGMSLMDTCAENLEARVRAIQGKIARLSSELDVLKTLDASESRDIEAVKSASRAAEVRQEFYKDLFCYVSDIADMLMTLGADIASKLNADVSVLESHVEKRARLAKNREPAFDGTRLHVDADGYASPPEPIEMAVNVVGQGLEASPAPEDIPNEADGSYPEKSSRTRNFTGRDSNPLAFVVDDFKSIPTIAGRFREWRTQYASDYAAAHGDLCLGKLCGAIASASGFQTDYTWPEHLPKAAVGPAVMECRCAQWAALTLLANWEPLSLRSSRRHAASFQKVRMLLSDFPVEVTAAQSLFYQVVYLVLKWKVDVLLAGNEVSNMLSEVQRVWTARATVKVMHCTATVMLGIGLRPDSGDYAHVERYLVERLMRGIICSHVEQCIGQEGSKGCQQALDFVLWAVKHGFCVYKDDSEVEFPRGDCLVWARMRKNLDHIYWALGVCELSEGRT